jgi:hypothetical protein
MLFSKLTLIEAVVCCRYYSLLKGPALLSAPEPGEHSRYFKSFPAFRGTGMTLSVWFRNCDPGEESLCGMFLLAASDGDTNTSALCWSVWVQNNGLYLDTMQRNPPYFYLLDFMTDRHTITHKAWRHLALVWDTADDSLAVYLDGELGVKIPWGSKVSEMDCSLKPGVSDKFVALGHDLPYSEWRWGAGD